MVEGVAENLFEALAEQSDQVIFAYDLSSNQFSYLNSAFENVWGKKREDILQRPDVLFKMIHPEDQAHVQEVFQDLQKGEAISDLEFRIKFSNQTFRWVCVKPVLQREQGVITGFVNDITDQKQYNDYLKKYSDKKNTILTILSHDLAGPLGLINNMAAALKLDLKAYPNADVQNLIGLIQRCSRQGMQLIQEFVNQEFLESCDVAFITRRVDLVQGLRECMESYQQTQHMTGKCFAFHTSHPQVYLEVDDNKLLQAINNLISNAIKFTPDGGQIRVSITEKEQEVLIEVADNGIGIPQKYHAALFDKFSPARREGIKGESSVGLGMSIIKTIVEWHQGQIRFKSQENEGSTFTVSLPKNK